MIKKIVLITLAVSVLAIAVAAEPRPTLAAGNTWHYSFAGMGADAGFSTCDYWPVPAGTVCTDTYISVAEQVYKEGGKKYPSTTMYMYQYVYKIDKKGNYRYVSDSWGWGDASLSINHKLTNASASAEMLMTTCKSDRHGNQRCQDSFVPVSATWSGVGDLVRTKGNYHSVSKGYTYNSHFSGTYRDATVEVSGMDVGALMWASLYNSRWMDVYVTKGAQ
jgi:hypothetical protein